MTAAGIWRLAPGMQARFRLQRKPARTPGNGPLATGRRRPVGAIWRCRARLSLGADNPRHPSQEAPQGCGSSPWSGNTATRVAMIAWSTRSAGS